MDSSLFLLCSVAGLIMVVGSLFLLWRGRIYLDHKGKQITQVELPMGIKFSTQFPVLVMFFFGVVLLIYPPYYFGKTYRDVNLCPDKSLHSKMFPEMVQVTSTVNSATPVDVYAVVGWQDKVRNTAILELPFKQGGIYRLLYSDGHGGMIPSDPFTLPSDRTPLKLQAVTFADAPKEDVQRVDPDKNKETGFK